MNPELKVIDQKIRDINIQAISNFYEMERDLVDAKLQKSYKDTLKLINTDNICLMASKFKDDSLWKYKGTQPLNSEECLQISDGILAKGLKTTIVQTLENIRQRTLQTLEQIQAEGQGEVLVANIKLYEGLQKYVQAPLMMVTKEI